MTPTQLEDAVYTWLDAETALKIIFLDQAAPRPKPPYFGIRLTQLPVKGHANRMEVDNSGIQSIHTDKEVMVEITGYGAGIADELQNIEDSLQRENVIDTLNSAGLFSRSEDGPNKISFQLNETIEERWLYTVVFGYVRNITEDTSFIATVTAPVGTIT